MSVWPPNRSLFSDFSPDLATILSPILVTFSHGALDNLSAIKSTIAFSLKLSDGMQTSSCVNLNRSVSSVFSSDIQILYLFFQDKCALTLSLNRVITDSG